MFEEEESCFRCEKSGREIKLLDAVYEDEMVKVCEKCASTEDIPVIRKPTTFQLKEVERPYSVYERLSRAAGLWNKAKKEEDVFKKIRQGVMKNDNNKLREKLRHDETQALNLIENFHWHIMRARRARKLAQEQLANEIGETEDIIKMVEQGSLPGDANRIIRKLEQFLRINLRKDNTMEEVEEMSGKRLERFGKSETEIREPARILNFDKETVKNLTIGDLMRMKRERKDFEKEADKKEEKIEKTEESNKKEQHEEKRKELDSEKKEKRGILGDEIEIVEGEHNNLK